MPIEHSGIKLYNNTRKQENLTVFGDRTGTSKQYMDQRRCSKRNRKKYFEWNKNKNTFNQNLCDAAEAVFRV